MEFVGTGSAATAASLRSASNGIVMQCAGLVGATFNGRAAGRRGYVRVVAKIKKGKMGPEEEYPWPDKFPPGEITDGALKYLNRFKPMPNPPKPVTLPFERPIVELENKIDEVRGSFVSGTWASVPLFWVALEGAGYLFDAFVAGIRI